MKKQFRRAFIELTNTCNLSCRFCVKTSRAPAFMPVEMFRLAARQTAPLAEIVSLHILGEPLLHPGFGEIMSEASGCGLKINLVTNGTLLPKCAGRLLEEPSLVQLSLSLHALLSLPSSERMETLDSLIDIVKAKPRRLMVSMRLRGDWTGEPERGIWERVFGAFDVSGAKRSHRGAVKLRDDIFLNAGALFDWPGGVEKKGKNGCLGLKHHFGVLCSGDVVPCCVDYDGRLAVGNIGEKPLAEILSSPGALALRDSISAKTPMPAYCVTCGFRAPR